jgi:hypothetical protein
MFTKAGFNPRGRTICRARIGRYGYRGTLGARMWRFQCSDVAWFLGRGQVLWPEQGVRIINLIDGVLPALRDSSCLLSARPDNNFTERS